MDLLPMSKQRAQQALAAHARERTASMRRMWGPGGQLAALFVTSSGLGWLALGLAPATQPDSAPFDTRFVHPWLWGATLLFVVPLWLFARRWTSLLLCFIAVVLVTAPHFGVFAVLIDRVSESELASGLEVFSIMVPLLFGACFALAVLIGRHEGLSRRQALARGSTRRS